MLYIEEHSFWGSLFRRQAWQECGWGARSPHTILECGTRGLGSEMDYILCTWIVAIATPSPPDRVLETGVGRGPLFVNTVCFFVPGWVFDQ